MTLEDRKVLAVLLVLVALLPLGRWLLGPFGVLAVCVGVGAGYTFYQAVLRKWFE